MIGSLSHPLSTCMQLTPSPQIHLLDPPTGTTVAILDLSRTVISHEYTHFRPRNAGGLFPYGRLGIWREPPLTWLQQNEDTIVPFSHASRSAKGKLSPETVMSIRPDNLLPGTETSPRGGIIALAWNGSGTLLASQNGTSRHGPAPCICAGR